MLILYLIQEYKRNSRIFYTILIFHTPHFLYSSFSTLPAQTPQTPHSAFSIWPKGNYDNLIDFITLHIHILNNSATMTNIGGLVARKYKNKTMICSVEWLWLSGVSYNVLTFKPCIQPDFNVSFGMFTLLKSKLICVRSFRTVFS